MKERKRRYSKIRGFQQGRSLRVKIGNRIKSEY